MIADRGRALHGHIYTMIDAKRAASRIKPGTAADDG
jgi:hypothetical protein